MTEIPFLGPILTVILAILVVYFAVKIGKKLIVLLVNSFLGLVILLIINFLPNINIEINLWSVLIAVIGGIPGIMLLIVLDMLGLAF